MKKHKYIFYALKIINITKKYTLVLDQFNLDFVKAKRYLFS